MMFSRAVVRDDSVSNERAHALEQRHDERLEDEQRWHDAE